MTRNGRGALLMTALSSAPGYLLAGCVLRAAAGHVIITEELGEQLQTAFTAIRTESTVAVCHTSDFFYEVGYDCLYVIDGHLLSSTGDLLSEFGLAGVFIDPLIAQVPDGAGPLTATYDLGVGPQPLVVSTVNSFKVTHAISVTAETGHKFLILVLPPSVEALVPTGVPTNGLPVSYTLQYEQSFPLGQPVPAQTAKLMLALRVELNGHKYYVPMLPCVTDFALVPPLTVPTAAQPQVLESAIGALPAAPCSHQQYFFNPEPPLLSQMIYLPVISR